MCNARKRFRWRIMTLANNKIWPFTSETGSRRKSLLIVKRTCVSYKTRRYSKRLSAVSQAFKMMFFSDWQGTYGKKDLRVESITSRKILQMLYHWAIGDSSCRGRLSRLSLSMRTNFLYTSRIGISTCDAIAHKWFKWRRSMLILVICFCVVFLLSLCLFFHDSNMIRQNLIKKARRLNQNTPISQWERAF